jgi:hypothetical protein
MVGTRTNPLTARRAQFRAQLINNDIDIGAADLRAL